MNVDRVACFYGTNQRCYHRIPIIIYKHNLLAIAEYKRYDKTNMICLEIYLHDLFFLVYFLQFPRLSLDSHDGLRFGCIQSGRVFLFVYSSFHIRMNNSHSCNTICLLLSNHEVYNITWDKSLGDLVIAR